MQVKVKVCRGFSIEYADGSEMKVAREGEKVSISKDEFDRFAPLGAVIGLDSASKVVSQDVKK